MLERKEDSRDSSETRVKQWPKKIGNHNQRGLLVQKFRLPVDNDNCQRFLNNADNIFHQCFAEVFMRMHINYRAFKHKDKRYSMRQLIVNKLVFEAYIKAVNYTAEFVSRHASNISIYSILPTSRAIAYKTYYIKQDIVFWLIVKSVIN